MHNGFDGEIKQTLLQFGKSAIEIGGLLTASAVCLYEFGVQAKQGMETAFTGGPSKTFEELFVIAGVGLLAREAIRSASKSMRWLSNYLNASRFNFD